MSVAQGSIFYGADTNDYNGFSVSDAGDVNGDGFEDFLIGANRAYAVNESRPNAGESYVVFGSSNIDATVDLKNLGSGGMVIYGAESLDRSGTSVNIAGDVNGDGFDDLDDERTDGFFSRFAEEWHVRSGELT